MWSRDAAVILRHYSFPVRYEFYCGRNLRFKRKLEYHPTCFIHLISPPDFSFQRFSKYGYHRFKFIYIYI
jgi:hypothetical protein